MHWRDPESKSIETKYVSNSGNFIQACKAGELDTMKNLVERTPVELEATDRDGGTSLHWAAEEGHNHAVLWMYEQGRCDMLDHTSLHYAVFKGYLTVVPCLCEQGADKEARSVDDWSPLHAAAANDHEARDHHDSTPLHVAVRWAHLSVV